MISSPSLMVQFYSILTEEILTEEVGLSCSPLLASLKQCVVELARSGNVLPSVQHAAQVVLRTGWEVLLPTVPERASALLQLLPNAEGKVAGDLGRQRGAPMWVSVVL